MSFDASVGGVSSNSYVLLSAAEDYFLGRLNTDSWDDAESDDQKAALMMATARLDSESYIGSVVSSTQRLQWPRSWVPDRQGKYYSSTAIPGVIQDATCELALALLMDPDLLGGSSDLSEFQNLQLGSLNVTPRVGTTAGALPPNVLRLIVSVRLSGYMNRVVRA